MLTGFTAGLLLITLSELGDKTFFIGAILAMRHPRRWVFLGVILALAAMTVLSVGLGQVATLLPQHYVEATAIALFLGFGLKLLYDASRMAPTGAWPMNRQRPQRRWRAALPLVRRGWWATWW
jgi:putative Ca2+/H+ antiporter (TMEM165/GDT1 family)